MDRRRFLRASTGAIATVGVAGGGSRPALARSADPLDDWFADVENFEGIVDATGQSAVRVAVGSQANGGAFGFDPAAVRVSPGTTVVWEWSGDGGVHNVVARDGTFESELLGGAGETFEHTFEADGVFRYACDPHEAMGMKGAVVLGDTSGESSAVGSLGADEILTGGLAGVLLVALFVLPLSEMRKRRRRKAS